MIGMGRIDPTGDSTGSVGDDEAEAIARLLASDYGVSDARIDRFSPDHSTYFATTPSSRCVIRVGRTQRHLAAALRALEAASYPAARVIAATNGAFVSELRGEADSREAIVLTFTEGIAPEFDSADLRAVGTALGHLHRHGSSIAERASQPADSLPAIERAGMLPDNELRFALRQLLPAEDRLPNRETAAQWRQLVDACLAGLHPIDGLTLTFLHGDAHPWNSLIAPTGAAQYIDWDSAGPGPAIIDLAFLVVSCATGGLIHPYTPTDPAVINSLLDGYRGQMSLSSEDLDALDSAVAFRILVCAAVGFGHHLQRGNDPLVEPGIQWSLRRLEEVPRIADTIRTALAD